MPSTRRSTSPRRFRLGALALLSLAPLTNCMCANMQRNRAYHRHLHEQLDGYTHEGTREAVASDVRELVVDRGYALGPWDGREPVVTSWQVHDEHRSRHRLELSPRMPGYAVRMTEEVQQQAPPNWVADARRRELDVEGNVLERIHPGRRETLPGATLASYEYDVSPSVLWEAVRDELAERGESMSTYDAPVDVTVSTAWVVYEGDAPTRLRHDVELVRVSDRAHRLEIHRTVERGEGPRPWQTIAERRDYDLEMALLRRRDATRASEIEAQARREGEEAFDRALDAGAVACGR
ncbi:MAG: hypothetical protein AB1Z98_00345 [Nannocystaceae bacterium]